MKLEHIAISINDKADINNFYKDILGMEKIKEFLLIKSFASEIFDINKEIPVFLLKKDELILEIFITDEQIKHNFNHICFSVKARNILIEKAEQNDYKSIRIKREFSDLIFIKDKSGNIFEIK